MNKYISYFLILILSIFFISCGVRSIRFDVSRNVDPSVAVGATDYTFLDYSSYILFKQNLISLNRIYTDYNRRDMEVNLNSPYELVPSKSICPNFNMNRPKKGIVLIHGLNQSPFAMSDLANYFASRCFLVRTVLLPGFGIRAGNLSDISYYNWIKDAEFVLKTLKDDHVDEIYIAGHSLGGTVAAYIASKQQKNIKGLFLFSPALDWDFYRGTTFLYSFLFPYSDIDLPLSDFAQYTATSRKADFQWTLLASKLNNKLQKNGMFIPVFMAESTIDNVVNLSDNLNVFTKYLYNKKDTLYLYSSNNYEDLSTLQNYFLDQRIHFINSFHPKLNILSQSHYSIIISPDNFHYGKNGVYKDCYYLLNSYSYNTSSFSNCISNSNGYSGEINSNLNRYYNSMKRIRFNPDFLDLTKKMDQFMRAIN